MSNVEHASAAREAGRQALGKYRILVQLGRGGMAAVYLALASGLAGFHKLVVLKVLHGDFAENDELVDMFLAEARLAARLMHPNVVVTHEVDVQGDDLFLVMEYLDGCPYSMLEGLLFRGEISQAVALRVLSDTLAGLHYVHELTDRKGSPLGLVHRDVSPQNILVTYEGHAKLLDFGIAKAGAAAEHTKQGTIKGKVRFMAPEQVSGGYLDRRVDVFAAGLLLWRILARKRPWEGLNDVAIMQKLIKGDVLPEPRTLEPGCPQELNDACKKSLSMSPDQRFQTAAELQAVLDDYLQNLGAAGSSRAVAAAMTAHFGKARAAFRREIDEQLSALETAERTRFEATKPSFRGKLLSGPENNGSNALLVEPYRASAPHPRSALGVTPTRGALDTAMTCAEARPPGRTHATLRLLFAITAGTIISGAFLLWALAPHAGGGSTPGSAVTLHVPQAPAASSATMIDALHPAPIASARHNERLRPAAFQRPRNAALVSFATTGHRACTFH